MPSGAVLIDASLAAYRPMGALDATDFAVLENGNEGSYVVSGCAVSPSGTAGKLDMTAGTISIAGVLYAVSSVTAYATSITSLVSSNSVTSGKAMWVAVEIDTSGALNLHAGTVATVATTPPIKPDITASRVCVAWLYVYYDPNFSSPTAVDALTGASNGGTGTANGNAKLIDGRALIGHLTALLGGYPGGQTVKGGTAAGEDLTLMSTAHATKGNIYLGATATYDEVNERLGLGNLTPAVPLDMVASWTVDAGGTTNFATQLLTADAAGANTTAATYRGMQTTISTGDTATGFTGSLLGLQFLAKHNSAGSAVNVATIYGMLGQAVLGNAATTNTPTATNIYGGQFQAQQRSDNNGTNVSGQMTAVAAIWQSVSRGTVTLGRGVFAELWHLAASAPSNATPPTTTTLVGFDLGFGAAGFTGGTVGTGIGLRLQAWPAGPTYTNGPYGLSVEGSTSLNWIQGLTQIGNAVAGTRPTSIGAQLVVYQVTLNNAVQALTSVATNDDPIEYVYQGRAATTDATVTTLLTKSLTASTTTLVRCYVVARRTGGSAGTADDGAAYVVSGTFQGGALIGSVLQTVFAENVAGYDCVIEYSANTWRIRVTGVANTNITWHATARVWQVGS